MQVNFDVFKVGMLFELACDFVGLSFGNAAIGFAQSHDETLVIGHIDRSHNADIELFVQQLGVIAVKLRGLFFVGVLRNLRGPF